MNGERFDVLYERYCDGVLDAAEREEFLRFLQGPEGRARFVDLATFEARVADELGVARAAEKASSRTLRAVRRRPPAARSRLMPWLTAGFAAASLLILFFTAGRAPNPAPPARAPEARRLEEPLPVVRTPDPAPVVAPAPPRREERAPEPLVVPTPRPADAAPRPAPAPRPDPRPAPPPGPPPFVPAEPPKESSVAAIAVVEVVVGKVSVSTATTCLDVAAGHPLRGDENIETADGAAARIRFNDGTRLTLGPDTMLARISEVQGGKSVRVDRGVLGAEVVKQARPMILAGPHAQATVLGTAFTFAVSLGATRLDVREGRVRFTRGASSVVVEAGEYVVAVPGPDLAVRKSTAAWRAPALGLIAWMKADGLDPGMRGVACWENLAGVGNHAMQPQAACQPKFVEEPRPCVRFDGQGDSLELPPGLSDFKDGLSAVVVARVAGGSGPGTFLDLGAGPACDNVHFGRRDGDLVFWAYANGQTRGRVEAPAVAVDQWAVYMVVAQAGGRTALYRNGKPVGGGDTSRLHGEARKSNLVGKSHGAGDGAFRGDIAELLLYQRPLSEAERQHIDAHLWAKYLDPSLPAPLPRLR